MKNFLKVLLISILFILIYFFSGTIFDIVTGEKNDIDIHILSDKMKDISELLVKKYEYHYSFLIENSKTTFGFTVPFTKSSKMVSYKGYLKSGINFEDIELKLSENNELTVYLAKSIIMENSIYTEEIQIKNIEDGIFSKDITSEIMSAIDASKKEVEKEKISDGFLDDSDKRVKKLLSDFFVKSNIENVTFEYN